MASQLFELCLRDRFFLIFVVLAVRVALRPGSAEGYKFMFTPRWEALKDPMIWIWALGQAFFLSLIHIRCV